MDTTNIEANFTTSSPGLSFTHQMSNTSNSISYKGPGPIEHPTAAPVQFCRRTDTIPFNPNSGRLPQKKPNLSFDPISSLAQMSQQLTSCVSINSNGLGNIGGSGMNDVNVPNSNNQIMEGIINSMDSGPNHCTTSSSSIGVSQHLSGHGPFVSNNCHINAMLGSVGQRLLSPKVCAGLGHVTGNIGRDGSSGIHGVVQTHRFVGRMGMNFGNFNVSSNIQVKASTPNTIQYMPMHPQNNNSDMRVPPSLEFLRYANAQISGTGNVVENSRICHGNAVSPSDPGKVNNSNNGQGGGGNTGIDFFGNCPQIDSLVGDHDELVGSNLVSGRNMNTVTHPSMTRTIRPVRHQQMGHPVNPMIPGARMQAAVGPMLTGPFPNEQQETMECGDSSLFIGSHSNGNVPQQGSAQMISGASNPGHIYSGANNLQKSIKPGSQSNICQNLNIQSVNNPQISTNIPSNEQISSMQSGINSAIMIANTGSMLSNAMQVGNNVSPSGCGGRSRNSPAEMGSVGYKPFVGPVSSDVKYAQQYHSFQQQLYATATRSQNSGNNSIIRNVSTNPTFFPNK